MPTKTSTESRDAAKQWTHAEVDAMKQRSKELKAQARRSPEAAREEGEREVQAKIADMTETDRAMAERIHAIVLSTAPDLVPRTYYGMPAYAKDGKVLCFFQPAAKFGSRYATFGFNDDAQLDDGDMWATSWAIRRLSAADEQRIAALVKKAVG